MRYSEGDGSFIKPPAWFLEQTQGWIPRGHSYSPWSEPTSWSGLSPMGDARVKRHKARQETNEQQQHEGRRRREAIITG